MRMKFQQNNPLVGYRKNLVLAAAIDLDCLRRLNASSSTLAKVFSAIETQPRLMELVNELAYSAVDRVVPDLVADLARDDIAEIPITEKELNDVLSLPIGSVLQVFQCEES